VFCPPDKVRTPIKASKPMTNFRMLHNPQFIFPFEYHPARYGKSKPWLSRVKRMAAKKASYSSGCPHN
ncbi:hypothetical protein, partial [Lacticaseibacillus paracasei]|uniref:hypothetical protein n=1 Tax=Lacticaseibacillus paracasei TaxID=1597 RepID=UPI001CDCBE28